METTEKTAVKTGAAILLISVLLLIFLIPPISDFTKISISIIQAGLAGIAILLSVLAIVTSKTYQTTHAFSFVAFWSVTAAIFMWLEISPVFLVMWALMGSLAAMLDDFNAILFIVASAGFTAYSYWSGHNVISDYFGVAIAGVLAPILGSTVNQHVKPTKTEELMMNKSSAEFALRSETVVDSISDGVIVIDSMGNILLINPAAINLIGWGREDAVGLNIQSVLTIIDSENTVLDGDQNPIMSALKSKTPYESKECKIQTKYSGKNIPIALSVNLSTDEDGGSIIVTFRDIERELNEGKEKSEFVSTASHEMRTPVASIEGYLGLALNPQTAVIDDRARQYLEKAHESSQHLGRLFSDLLDVTKLEDNQIKLHPEPIEATEFVRKAAEALVPDINTKGLSYIFRPDVMKTGEKTINPAYFANVDTGFLRETVNNLIENAIKYNSPNGSIEVNVTGGDDNVLISVKDSGIGIPPEDVDHLFQKFYRVDSSDTREIGGTGLGLYITKQRIENMNGKVWVESEYHKGSTFFISIPRIGGNEYELLKTEMASRTMQRNDVETQKTNPSPTNAINSNYYPAQPSGTAQVADSTVANASTEVAGAAAVPTQAQTIATNPQLDSTKPQTQEEPNITTGVNFNTTARPTIEQIESNKDEYLKFLKERIAKGIYR